MPRTRVRVESARRSARRVGNFVRDVHIKKIVGFILSDFSSYLPIFNTQRGLAWMGMAVMVITCANIVLACAMCGKSLNAAVEKAGKNQPVVQGQKFTQK